MSDNRGYEHLQQLADKLIQQLVGARLVKWPDIAY